MVRIRPISSRPKLLEGKVRVTDVVVTSAILWRIIALFII